jgi:hypothetical protein
LHLLRDNSDIGFFASIINEAIEAKAVVEMAEQDDLVLKPRIGSPSAATATTSKAASAAVKTDLDGVPGEWSIAPGSDATRANVNALRAPLCSAKSGSTHHD